MEIFKGTLRKLLLLPVIITVLTFLTQTLVAGLLIIGAPYDLYFVLNTLNINLDILISSVTMLNIITITTYLLLSLTFRNKKQVVIVALIPLLNIIIALFYCILIYFIY